MKQSEALDMITKIQLAHQAMESACKRIDELKEENKNLKEALAKQEQGEPVTWRNATIRVGEDLCSVGPFGYYDMTAEQWLDWALSVVTVHLPPQQRTWVGLTDEDRQAAFESMPDMLDGFLKKWGWLHFSKAIEAKLKEKNT